MPLKNILRGYQRLRSSYKTFREIGSHADGITSHKTICQDLAKMHYKCSKRSHRIF